MKQDRAREHKQIPKLRNQRFEKLVIPFHLSYYFYQINLLLILIKRMYKKLVTH